MGWCFNFYKYASSIQSSPNLIKFTGTIITWTFSTTMKTAILIMLRWSSINTKMMNPLTICIKIMVLNNNTLDI